MKILFTIPKLEFADHIAISYLSAISKQLGHTSYFCALNLNDFSQMVRKLRPEIVAYSVNSLGFQGTIAAHREAAKEHKFISIMGGPHPTLCPETFAESGIDAYCIGEGEYAFKDFLQCVESGKPYDEVDNLITKRRINSVRPLINNLDELPLADRHLVIANSFLKDAAKKTFYAARGCPFHCAYCCNNHYHKLYKGKGPILRRFSVERIIREIEDVKMNFRMDFVRFGDDCFVWKADDWFLEFVEKYPRRIGVLYSCYLRFDLVNDDLLKLLKKSGCHSVILSVDSTSKHVREDILKRTMRDIDIQGNLRKIREHGIHTLVNFMLAAPESTLKDDLETLYLSRRANVSYLACSTTVPMKGTELYDYCVSKKMIDPLTYKNDMSGCSDKSRLPCFSEREKNIRYNIFLLGPLISRLPYPLFKFAVWLIHIIPPNRLFRKVQKHFYEYCIKNIIFKIPKGV